MTPTYNRSDIIGWMARTIEVLSYMAWCDAWDEYDNSPAKPGTPADRPDDCLSAGPGEDWFDIAPERDQSDLDDYGINWREEAAILYGRICGVWRGDPWLILANNNITSRRDAERWAHLAVMSAVGHGVFWEDDHETLTMGPTEYEVPHFHADIPDYPGEWPEQG